MGLFKRLVLPLSARSDNLAGESAFSEDIVLEKSKTISIFLFFGSLFTDDLRFRLFGDGESFINHILSSGGSQYDAPEDIQPWIPPWPFQKNPTHGLPEDHADFNQPLAQYPDLGVGACGSLRVRAQLLI